MKSQTSLGNSRVARGAVIAGLVFLLSACAEESRSAAAIPKESHPAIAGQAPLRPQKDVVVAVESQAGTSAEKLIAPALTVSEMRQVERLKASYFGLGAGGHERYPEVPTPEEWAVAFRKSDEQLKREAETGDITAKFLWADRLLGLAERDVASNGPDAHGIEAFVVTDEIMRASRSPFAAYLFGRQMYNLSTTRNPAYVVAALQVGYSRGDARARDALVAFEANHPGVDQALVTQIINSVEKQHKPKP